MKKIILSSFIVFVQACSMTPNYTCGNLPEGKCESVSEIHKKVNQKIADEEDSHEIRQNMIKISPIKSETPLLTRPKVLKVYVNRWADKEGDLNLGRYIFLKIEGSKWQVQ